MIESVSSTCVLHSQICRNNCAMNTLGKRVSITLGLQGTVLKLDFPTVDAWLITAISSVSSVISCFPAGSIVKVVSLGFVTVATSTYNQRCCGESFVTDNKGFNKN